MRRTTSRIRLLLLVLLLAATSAGAWVQLNLRDSTAPGAPFPDVGLELIANNAGCCGGNPQTISSTSITFRREQDGSADAGAANTATALQATFTAIGNIADSNATVVDSTFNLTEPINASAALATDGLNSVYFFANDDIGFGGLAAAFFAFSPANGGIVDCDILFDDSAGGGITWSTATPGDPNQDVGVNTFDIQEVMNQEVQHCFGFEHTPIVGVFNSSGYEIDPFNSINPDFSLQASLYPFATGTTQGRTFEPDDIAAFSALYPAGATLGSITGSVTMQGGAAVKGAHVVAVDPSDPDTPLVGALSGVNEGLNGTGVYTISGLPAGTYLVRLEPLTGYPNSFLVNETDGGNTFFNGGVSNFPPEFHSTADSATDAMPDPTDATMVTVVAGGTTTGVDFTTNTVTTLAAMGGNDNLANATVLASPFAEALLVLDATTEGTDNQVGLGTCWFNFPFRTVWYQFTAPSNGMITFSARGSAYDTAIAAVTGNAPTFVEVGCDDDISAPDFTNLQSEVTFAATSGTVYRFVVSDSDLDGNDFFPRTLVVNFTFVGTGNAAPVAVNDPLYVTGPNQQLVIAAACPDGAVASPNNGLLCNDTDAEMDPIMVDVPSVTQPANGAVVVMADGSFTYTPDLGFSGMDTFSYRATDGALSNVATVTITVAQCTRDFDNTSADNQFETTNNWNPDGVPGSGANEVLCIGGAFPVTHSAGVETIFSLRHTSSQPLTFNGGTLSIDGNSQIGSGGLVLTNGALDMNVGTTLTINGPTSWQAGTMAGSGGAFVFAGGGTLSSAGNKTLTGALVTNPNGQTVTWSDGNIRINDGSVFTNAGILSAQADNQITNSSSTGGETFVNSGTFTKAAGAGVTSILPPVFFSNTGTVNVNSGDIIICGAGSSTGAFNVAMNTTLGFAGNCGVVTFNHNSGSSVIGAGEMLIGDQETVNFNNSSSLSTATRIGQGTLNLTTGNTTTVPSLEFQDSGTVNANNALTIGATGLTWPCGTFGGTQTITLNGPATLGPGCALPRVLNGPSQLINNGQTVTWTSGNIEIGGGSTFANLGSFDIQTDAFIMNAGGGGAIVNQGTFSKASGAGPTQVDAAISFIHNAGFVEVLSGSLEFGSTYTQNGGITRLDGGNLSGTQFDLNGGSLEGAGFITGNVNNIGATIGPGLSPGVLNNQAGALNIFAGGAFSAELGGTTPGNTATDHDQYNVNDNVNGTANINGTLNVTLFGGFMPMIGDTFDIITANVGRNGTFTTLNLPSVAPNSFQVNYLANSVQLEVVANAAPNAVDDNAVTLEDTFVDINVLANDTDTDGPNPLSIDSFTQPANGVVTDQGGGILRYTPDLNENNVTMAGMDTFTYTVTDGSGINFVMANVNVDVTPVNDAPTYTQNFVGAGGPEDGFSQVSNVTINSSPGSGGDEVSQVLTFIVLNDNPGLFAVPPAIDAVTGELTFMLAQDANGSANLTITLMDDGGTANGGVDTSSPPTMFLLDVFPVNDAPVATDDMFTVGENSMNNILPVEANDAPGPPTATDEVSQTLTITMVGAPDMGGTAMTDGTTITYSPATNFTGVETFTYTTDDGNGGTDTATVTVNVIANFPPNAVDDVANTNEDSFVDTNVLSNDDDGGDGGALSVVGFTQGANGAVTDQGGGILRYTPNPDFNGMDSYTYDVSDTFSTDTGTVNVTVVAVNDAPSFTDAGDVTVAEDSGAQTVAGWASNIMPGPATATDEAAQVLTFNVTANTNAALFSAQPAVNATTGDLTFTPAPNAFGSADITLVLMDDGGTANGGDDTSASSTFTITVTNINDPPVITAGPTSNPVSPIPGNTATGANVAFSITVSDPDGDPLTFSWTGGCGASSVEDPTLACPFGMGLSVDVTVSDPSMATDTGNIVVDVTDYSIAANCTTGMPPCNSATMATIAAGQAVDFSLTATGINGTYAANITYACQNLPAFTTCTFTPSASVASAPPGGVVTMLRIQTTAPGFAQLHAPASQQSQPPFLALFLTVPGLALFGLVLAGGRRKRRSLGTLCLLAIVLVMATVLVGCGSGGDFFTSLGSPGTPVGSHSITINATGSGTLQHSVNLTVVVQ